MLYALRGAVQFPFPDDFGVVIHHDYAGSLWRYVWFGHDVRPFTFMETGIAVVSPKPARLVFAYLGQPQFHLLVPSKVLPLTVGFEGQTFVGRAKAGSLYSAAACILDLVASHPYMMMNLPLQSFSPRFAGSPYALS